MSYTSFDSLDELAATLPFRLDDTPAVNAAYIRWHATQDLKERSVVQLWTYCFIRRYFLVKFIQDSSWSATDLDVLVDIAFRKTEMRESQVREPDRYASWVSVVCKNTFRNYLRSKQKQKQVAIDREQAGISVSELPNRYREHGAQELMLVAAIDRLPPHLRACVRLRFLGGLSYAEIARRTERPLPTIRAFVYRAVKRMRKDDDLLTKLE